MYSTIDRNLEYMDVTGHVKERVAKSPSIFKSRETNLLNKRRHFSPPVAHPKAMKVHLLSLIMFRMENT